MTPDCPTILRKGAVVRVGTGWPRCDRAVALSSVDLRFDDGHVERWLGPGRTAERVDVPQTVPGLVEWGELVIEQEAGSLLAELATGFTGVVGEAFSDVPVEVVVEWNQEIVWPWEESGSVGNAID